MLLAVSVAALFAGLSDGQKLALVIGVTVAAVTGMWVALYRRGKK